MNIRKERAGRLIELSNELEAAFAEAQVGKTHRLLVETVKDGVAEGYTPEYVRAGLKTSDTGLQGKTIVVKAVSSENNAINVILG